ncbi:hypothetical protein ACW2Q0_00690 [Nocardia sp. R16R-3T]
MTYTEPEPGTNEYIWFVGYEHLVDSLRRDTTDTPRERAESAHTAALMFASAQARALAQLADHCPQLLDRLGELVEQQRIANALTGGTGYMGVLNSDAELRPARNAVRRLLGLEVEE